MSHWVQMCPSRLVPNLEPLAQLVAIADMDKVARLRLLRGLRDVEGG